jgi:hypothetical protein
MFGIKQTSSAAQGPRFIEKEKHFIGGCKEIVILIDMHTEIQYMTTPSPKSNFLMMRDAFGKPLVTNKSSSKRFVEKERQLVAGCKEVMIFVDKHTGVQYMTTTAPNSSIIMLKDTDGNPLFED